MAWPDVLMSERDRAELKPGIWYRRYLSISQMGGWGAWLSGAARRAQSR